MAGRPGGISPPVKILNLIIRRSFSIYLRVVISCAIYTVDERLSRGLTTPWLERNGRNSQWFKKKRSPEETLGGLHAGGRRHQPRGSCGLVHKS